MSALSFNLKELHYYPFVVSVNKFGGSCNSVDDPFGRICVPNKTKDVIFKKFNMIKDANELKTLSELISCDFNVNLMVENVAQDKNRTMISVNVNVKI